MTITELAQVSRYFKFLSEVENGIARFYQVCSGYWPEEEIWAGLAREEKVHAESVLAMLAAVEAAPEKFTLLKPLVMRPLELFMEGLRTDEAKVRSGAYKKINAMAVSRDIEHSLIESRYDNLLESRDAVYNTYVRGMIEDTRRHGAAFSSRLATLGIIK